MARKKYIDDETLITLIDTYYLESGRSECITTDTNYRLHKC